MNIGTKKIYEIFDECLKLDKESRRRLAKMISDYNLEEQWNALNKSISGIGGCLG